MDFFFFGNNGLESGEMGSRKVAVGPTFTGEYVDIVEEFLVMTG